MKIEKRGIPFEYNGRRYEVHPTFADSSLTIIDSVRIMFGVSKMMHPSTAFKEAAEAAVLKEHPTAEFQNEVVDLVDMRRMAAE